MRAKLPPILVASLFLSWLLSGCAPAATRGYLLEPADQTVRIPLFVDAIEREDQSQTIYIWPKGYEEIEGDMMMCFLLQTKGHGPGVRYANYQLAMDTGDCDHPTKVMPIPVWSFPPQPAKIERLNHEIDSIRALPDPEPHWTEVLFETFAPRSAARESKESRKQYEDEVKSKKSSEIRWRAEEIRYLKERTAMQSMDPKQFQYSTFTGLLKFPWNPRACNLDILYTGSDSTHHFPFRQIRPR